MNRRRKTKGVLQNEELWNGKENRRKRWKSWILKEK